MLRAARQPLSRPAAPQTQLEEKWRRTALEEVRKGRLAEEAVDAAVQSTVADKMSHDALGREQAALARKLEAMEQEAGGSKAQLELQVGARRAALVVAVGALCCSAWRCAAWRCGGTAALLRPVEARAGGGECCRALIPAPWRSHPLQLQAAQAELDQRQPSFERLNKTCARWRRPCPCLLHCPSQPPPPLRALALALALPRALLAAAAPTAHTTTTTPTTPPRPQLPPHQGRLPAAPEQLRRALRQGGGGGQREVPRLHAAAAAHGCAGRRLLGAACRGRLPGPPAGAACWGRLPGPRAPGSARLCGVEAARGTRGRPRCEPWGRGLARCHRCACAPAAAAPRVPSAQRTPAC
jgi:hypothetical protein